jgi:hypothetical protein
VGDRSSIPDRDRRPVLYPLRPDQLWGPPRVPGALSPGVKWGCGVMLTAHPILVPRLRKSRSYTSSPPKRLSWRVAGQLYFTLLFRLQCHRMNNSNTAAMQNFHLTLCLTVVWTIQSRCTKYCTETVIVVTIAKGRLRLPATNGHIIRPPDDRGQWANMEQRSSDIHMRKLTNSEKHPISAILSTIIPEWTAPGPNSGLRRE